MASFGSLFAGIGGVDLGLERAGWQCRWQVEIDEFCRGVLTRHWPEVPKYADVREFPPHPVEQFRVDAIVGGFPCQDVSAAGSLAGIGGSRSGLWFEFARILRVLRPRYALIENVPGLVDRGFERVLADLAQMRFDAEWTTVSAASVGAAHIRHRLFILAYPSGERCLPTPIFDRISGEILRQSQGEQWQGAELRELDGVHGKRVRVFPPPGIQRVADGSPPSVDRFRAIGNAVVPQVAELIGKVLMDVLAKS